MARSPLELTPAQKAEVETLAAVLTTEQISDYFGIGRRTFYAMMERDEEIAARYKKGKARAIGAIAQGLIAKARGGDTTSMIFYLKTQAGWRETQQLEMTGQNGGPIQTSDTGSARQQLLLRINALSRSMQGVAEAEAIAAEPVNHEVERIPVLRSLP